MSMSGKNVTSLKGTYGSTQSFASTAGSWLEFVKHHKGEGRSLKELGQMYKNVKSTHTMPNGKKMRGRRHRK